MAQKELIDKYVDRAAFATDTEFVIANLKQVADQYKKLKDVKIGGPGAGLKETAAAAKLAQLELAQLRLKTQELTNAQKQLAIETKKEANEQKAANQAKREATAFEKALAKEKAASASATAAEANLVSQLTDDYYLLNKSLKDAEARYKSLALSIGFEADATKEALEQALSIRGVLDKLDGNLKNYQRNVGNYKSAFDGLGFSFTQVARELPSLAINTQTFFLAISNNLPMVFDEVKKARQEIKALKAEGQATEGLGSRIVKSIFSFNVIIGAVIALFTIFSKQITEAISGLFGFSNGAEKAAAAADRLVAAQLRLLNINKDLNALVFEDITGVDRMEKELQIANALGKSRGDILAIEKKIVDARALAANKRFFDSGGFETLKQAQVEVLNQQLQLNSLIKRQAAETSESGRKEYDKDIERAERRLELAKSTAETQKKIVRDNFEGIRDIELKRVEIDRYNAQQRLLVETEFAKDKAQAVINNNDRILADERNFEASRVAALRSSAVQRKKIIDQQIRQVKGDPGNVNSDGTLTAEARTAINKANKEKSEIDKKLQVDIFNTQEEFRKRRLTAEKDAFDTELSLVISQVEEIAGSEANGLATRLRAVEAYVQENKDLLQKDYDFQVATKVLTDEELIALQVAYNAKLKNLQIKAQKDIANIVVGNLKTQASLLGSEVGLSSAGQQSGNRGIKDAEKRAEENRKIEYRAASDILMINIGANKEILSSDKTTKDQKLAAQIELNNQLAALYKLDTENYIAEQDYKQKVLLNDLNKIGETVNQAFAVISAANDAASIREKNRIEAQIEGIEKVRDAELAANDRRVQSDQDRAANAILINSRAQAQKEALERRQRQLDQRRAAIEKAQAIFQIILGTAVAVAKETKLPLKILQAALGAAQLAIAISTPLPRFKDGLYHDYEGKALINDGGKREAILRADGSVELPQGMNQVETFKKGDRVMPDADAWVNTVIRAAFKGNPVRGAKMGQPVDESGKKLDAIERAIRNQRGLSLSGTHAGAIAMWRSGAMHTSYVHEQTNW